MIRTTGTRIKSVMRPPNQKVLTRKVPAKWLPAYEVHIQGVERKIAVVAAWALLATVMFYQLTHQLRVTHQPDLWLPELGFRIPVLLSALITLFAHYTGKPRFQSRQLLRFMGFSIMAMILALFLFHHKGQTANINQITNMYQISNMMIISFFVVSAFSVRGIGEWLLMLALPLALFCLAAWAKGLTMEELLPFMFDPLVMMVIGLVMSEALRQMRLGEFMARQQLQEQATTDQLTGLLNRRAMHHLLQQEHARAQRYGTTYSLILGDLDRFKRVNDRYGHNIGDIVLEETARRLGRHIRAEDALCRWGGEEFLILLPQTNLDGAMHVAEKARLSLADVPMDTGEHSIPQTISLGMTSCSGVGDIESAIKRADDALYLAKANGRNRTEAISPPDPDPVISANDIKPAQTAEP